MTANTLTVITPISPNTAFGLTPFSMREGSISLDPFSGVDGDDAFGSTVQITGNGKVIDLSHPQFKLYQTDITCTDSQSPAFDQGWRGAKVQIDFPLELSDPVGSITLNGAVTAGGSSIVVNSATGISAGGYLMLTGGTIEQVQVSNAYAGGSTVALVGTLAQNHGNGTPVVPVGRLMVPSSTPRVANGFVYYRPRLLMVVTLFKNGFNEFPHRYSWRLRAIETTS